MLVDLSCLLFFFSCRNLFFLGVQLVIPEVTFYSFFSSLFSIWSVVCNVSDCLFSCFVFLLDDCGEKMEKLSILVWCLASVQKERVNITYMKMKMYMYSKFIANLHILFCFVSVESLLFAIFCLDAV